mgnify:CR=1 FL=1
MRPGDNQDSDEIEFVLPRISLLIRNRSMRGRSEGKSNEQILAANVNTVFIVQAANNFNVSRLEREVALVWSSGAVPVIVVSKIDLIQDVDSLRFVRRLELAAPGVGVFAVSGLTGKGIALLHRFITAGETVALVGASGVGKSTLANQLIGEKVMDTSDIRKLENLGKSVETLCKRNIKCAFDKVWAYLDITKDGHLSLSEIARFQRNIVKFAAVHQDQNVLKTEDIAAINLASIIFLPITASSVLHSFDYNNDGLLSKSEVLDDTEFSKLVGVNVDTLATGLDFQSLGEKLKDSMNQIPFLK